MRKVRQWRNERKIRHALGQEEENTLKIDHGVTLYTKDHCPNCTKMKRALGAKNVPYTEAPITPEVATWAKGGGVMQAPILTIGTGKTEYLSGGFNRYGVEFAAEHFGGDK